MFCINNTHDPARLFIDETSYKEVGTEFQGFTKCLLQLEMEYNDRLSITMFYDAYSKMQFKDISKFVDDSELVRCKCKRKEIPASNKHRCRNL